MKISAYIPCWNNAPTLPHAVESVRRLGPRVAELFVIDDGSTDASPALARGLGLRVLVNARNLGRGAVRARALLEASHPLVLGCDATMALPPDFLERALPWFQDPAVAAVMGRVGVAESPGAVDRWRARHLFKTEAPAVVHERASLATGGALLHRAHLLGAGNFRAEFRQGEDAELGARLLARGHKVVFDPGIALRALNRNTLGQVLERYWRWNVAPAGCWGFRDYLRQTVYSLKAMACQDLRQGDLGAAVISLLCPHYLLWKTGCRRTPRNRS
jgi:glycosyltransferase involved in cell wall biosynthesis